MPNKLTGLVKNRTINSLLIICFFAVTMVPLIILGVKSYEAAWNNAWREIHEKHQLLATNLAAPISFYINSHKKDMYVIGQVVSDEGNKSFRKDTNYLVSDFIKSSEGLMGVSIFTPKGSYITSTYRTGLSPHWDKFDISTKDFFKKSLTSHEPVVSHIYRSPTTGHPGLFIAYCVKSSNGKFFRVLVAELNTDPIEKLREGVKFGKRGHCAIVDATGHVVAHPNPKWREEIHDLSKLSVVKKMMAGKTGVTEFYSPFIRQQMVAGYASVPGLHWGIMIPQPKPEIRAQVNQIVLRQLGWAALGLILAIALAIALARWITHPINALVKVADEMVSSKFMTSWPSEKLAHGPREINRLIHAFRELVNGLINSREIIEKNNESLKQQIEKATHDLRIANQQLAMKAQQDHLTGLHNRRSFEEHLTHLSTQENNRREDADALTMIMVDVDEFKAVNDTYGHLAGDAVLTHIAKIISDSMRESDILARYAGDEFIGLIKANLSIARKRADTILEQIERNPIEYEGQKIEVTVSIGLMECGCPEGSSDLDCWNDIIRRVDEAMYTAKDAGKNAIAVVENNHNKSRTEPQLRIIK